MTSSIDPVNNIAVTQTFKDLKYNLRLPTIVAIAAMFRPEIVTEALSETGGKILIGCSKKISVNLHVAGLSVDSLSTRLHPLISEGEKNLSGHGKSRISR
jgi:hypothetical protein